MPPALPVRVRRRILLTDHTKFGLDHLAQVAGLSELDAILTDSAFPDAAVTEVEEAGPRVVRA